MITIMVIVIMISSGSNGASLEMLAHTGAWPYQAVVIWAWKSCRGF